MREMTESGKVPGCAAAVRRDGKPLFREFVGYSDIDNHIPVSEHTAFRLASMTKPVTATSVLLCMERGLLRLDDVAAKYIPALNDIYLAKKNPDGSFSRGEQIHTPIRICDLLTHSSGFGTGESGGWLYEQLKPRQGDTIKSTTDRYAANALLAFPPASAQEYSPVMAFDLLVRIVEETSGMGYADFVRQNIFDPLGMTNTSYKLTDFAAKDLAISYKLTDGKLVGKTPDSNFADYPDGYTGGGAGLIATLDDYVKFAQAILDSYLTGGGLLQKTSVELMKKAWLDETKIAGLAPTFNWGLGVRVVNMKTDWQRLTDGSFGWSGAYGSHFWIDCKERLVAVYMHNSDTFGGAGAPHTLDFEHAVMQ